MLVMSCDFVRPIPVLHNIIGVRTWRLSKIVRTTRSRSRTAHNRTGRKRSQIVRKKRLKQRLGKFRITVIEPLRYACGDQGHGLNQLFDMRVRTGVFAQLQHATHFRKALVEFSAKTVQRDQFAFEIRQQIIHQRPSGKARTRLAINPPCRPAKAQDASASPRSINPGKYRHVILNSSTSHGR